MFPILEDLKKLAVAELVARSEMLNDTPVQSYLYHFHDNVDQDLVSQKLHILAEPAHTGRFSRIGVLSIAQGFCRSAQTPIWN